MIEFTMAQVVRIKRESHCVLFQVHFFVTLVIVFMGLWLQHGATSFDSSPFINHIYLTEVLLRALAVRLEPARFYRDAQDD